MKKVFTALTSLFVLSACGVSASRLANAEDPRVNPLLHDLSTDQQKQIFGQIDSLKKLIALGEHHGVTDSGDACWVKAELDEDQKNFYLTMDNPRTNWERNRLQYVWGIETFNTNFFGVTHPYKSAKFEMDQSRRSLESSYKTPSGYGVFAVVLNIAGQSGKLRVEMKSSRSMTTLFASTFECTVDPKNQDGLEE